MTAIIVNAIITCSKFKDSIFYSGSYSCVDQSALYNVAGKKDGCAALAATPSVYEFSYNI
jgi:hypothetical protein